MTPRNQRPLSPPPSPSRWAALLARMRASAWSAIGVKVGTVVVALLVLGWIGRTAAARPSPSSALGSIASIASLGSIGSDRDAGAPLPTVIAIDAGATPVVAPAGGAAPAPPAPPPAAATASGSRGRASSSEPVFLNHASVDELRRLPGVGPKRAEAILVLRQRLGRFQRVEDLLRVKGIGRGTVKKWRPLVRLDSPAAPAAPDAPGAATSSDAG